MASSQSPKRPRRRWQFSLATLFILMTIVCLILSRFYPRIYASVEVQLPAMTAQTVPTYMQVVRTKHILSGVANRRLELANTSDMATLSWLQSHLEVRHVGKDVLEIRMSGRPSERKRLQAIVDAIAEEYVDFMTELTHVTSDEAIATLQETYDKLETEEAQANSLPQEVTEEPTGSSKRGDAESVRRQQMMQKIASEIEELQQGQKKLPPAPQVIGRRSGLDW